MVWDMKRKLPYTRASFCVHISRLFPSVANLRAPARRAAWEAHAGALYLTLYSELGAVGAQCRLRTLTLVHSVIRQLCRIDQQAVFA